MLCVGQTLLSCLVAKISYLSCTILYDTTLAVMAGAYKAHGTAYGNAHRKTHARIWESLVWL